MEIEVELEEKELPFKYVITKRGSTKSEIVTSKGKDEFESMFRLQQLFPGCTVLQFLGITGGGTA
ncbi:MAG: hypothetical protein ACE5JU_22515 [Candidatus Binatia bacterium]